MAVINVAVAGATGAIGEALIEALDKTEFTSGDLYLLASQASNGETRLYKNRPVLVEDMASFDFAQVQLVFLAVPESVSRDYADPLMAAGCRVVDFSAYFRHDHSVPLVVAGVNSEALQEGGYDGGTASEIVALPDSLAVDLSHVLHPIHQNTEIVRINVASYQSVSSAGREGAKELARQTSNLLNGLPVEPAIFPQQIAFNVVPELGGMQDSGHSGAELSLVNEMRRVLQDQNLPISATCVQVPIFYGTCQAVNIETRYPVDVEEVIGILRGVDELEVSVGGSQVTYPVPLTVADSSGKGCSVGRIRASIGIENGIDLWIVSDSVRKSAVYNALGVAKLLIKSIL